MAKKKAAKKAAPKQAVRRDTRKRRRSTSAYTYRGGEKMKLQKRDDQFVVRRTPDQLSELTADTMEQVSSASTLLSCSSGELEKLMKAARESAIAYHAYEIAGTDEQILITDRIFVRFKEALSPEEVGRFAGRYALTYLKKYSETDYLFRLTNETGINPVKLVVKLTETDDAVALAEHSLNHVVAAMEPPADTLYAAQWHLHKRARAGSDYDPRSSSNCEDAWEILGTRGDSNVVIGVTDDGCQLDHPDFDDGGKFTAWGYFEGDVLRVAGSLGSDSDRMYQSGANHGTSCAGVIGAETDGQMTVGAAPECSLLPIKFESNAFAIFAADDKLRSALDYVADKVDVLSNSWGKVSSKAEFSEPLVVERMTELAATGGRRGRGILFLWAAGNFNRPLVHKSVFPIPSRLGPVTSPAAVRTDTEFSNNLVGIPGVLQVAAITSTAQRSHYSNYGTGIDVCAPSNNVHTYFRLPLEGRGIVTTTGNDDVTGNFGGTSSATPLVAGVAGLVISANPDITAIELAALLKRTASKDLNFTGWPKSPPLLPNDPNPTWDVSPVAPFDRGEFIDRGDAEGTWSPWFGHGKVDAAEAVRAALGAAPVPFVDDSEAGAPFAIADELAAPAVGPTPFEAAVIDLFSRQLSIIEQLAGSRAEDVSTEFEGALSAAAAATARGRRQALPSTIPINRLLNATEIFNILIQLIEFDFPRRNTPVTISTPLVGASFGTANPPITGSANQMIGFLRGSVSRVFSCSPRLSHPLPAPEGGNSMRHLVNSVFANRERQRRLRAS